MSQAKVNPKEVHDRVEAIRGTPAYADGDAHREEDRLHRDVLEAIAEGTIVDAQTCARLALTTREIEFSRWYE